MLSLSKSSKLAWAVQSLVAMLELGFEAVKAELLWAWSSKFGGWGCFDAEIMESD